MAEFEAKFVKCPFYHRCDSNRIVCEGLSQRNTINLVYELPEERLRYMQEKCYSIEGSRKCAIYGLLDRKWAEEL